MSHEPHRDRIATVLFCALMLFLCIGLLFTIGLKRVAKPTPGTLDITVKH